MSLKPWQRWETLVIGFGGFGTDDLGAGQTALDVAVRSQPGIDAAASPREVREWI